MIKPAAYGLLNAEGVLDPTLVGSQEACIYWAEELPTYNITALYTEKQIQELLAEIRLVLRTFQVSDIT